MMGALEPSLCLLGPPPSALHSGGGGYSATGIALWGPPQGFVGVHIGKDWYIISHKESKM